MGEALEIVRRQYDAFQNEDWDAFFALYDPEVEIDLSRSGIPTGASTTDTTASARAGRSGVVRGTTTGSRWRS